VLAAAVIGFVISILMNLAFDYFNLRACAAAGGRDACGGGTDDRIIRGAAPDVWAGAARPGAAAARRGRHPGRRGSRRVRAGFRRRGVEIALAPAAAVQLGLQLVDAAMRACRGSWDAALKTGL
jgi:hypothetical protein